MIWSIALHRPQSESPSIALHRPPSESKALISSAELLTETGKEEKIGEFYTDFFGTLEDGEAEDWGGGVAPARVQERVSSYSKHCALDFMRRALGFQI
eukprot:40705-Amorphochlora_amoeboformis.AAC.1